MLLQSIINEKAFSYEMAFSHICDIIVIFIRLTLHTVYVIMLLIISVIIFIK